jgi:hypothetical protein
MHRGGLLTVMLRLGYQIRLHKSDIERVKQLTGVELKSVCSVEEFNHFIEEQLVHLDKHTPESRLLKLLLSDERLEA